MAMTRKDYALVAKALANQRESISNRVTIEFRTLDETIENMAAHFALMNDSFKKDVFMEAAGYGESSNN